MQKKNRKGFTLIELLAVIVILAIIALIAVPVIMNVITKARVSAFEDSAYGVVKAGEMYYTNKLLDAEGMTEDQEFKVNGDVFQNIEDPNETLDLSGSIPKSGKVKVTTDGKVALAISNGEYCIRKATTESKVKAEKLSDIGNNCDYKTEVATPNPVFTTTTDGKAIPACIADNTECSDEAIKDGLKVGVKVNDSETKNFYVISEDASKNEITLIMDSNIDSTTVAWVTKEDYLEAGGTESDYGDYGNTNKGPLTALAYLKTQTSGWTNIPETTYDLTDDNITPLYSPIENITARARLLTKTEAEGLGCTTSSGSCTTWLYENLGTFDRRAAYWTSSSSNYYSANAYYVCSEGHIDTLDTSDDFVNTGGIHGIRPVITISKTII